MNQIVCQNGAQKCLYVATTSYLKLREDIFADFDDLSPDFELMYVDENFGDWMLVENQSDLDRVLSLRKEYFLIKVLPPIQRDNPQRCESDDNKVGKLIMTQQLRRMVDFVAQKHLERYFTKKRTQKMMVTETMRENQAPPLQKKLTEMNPLIQKRMLFEKKNGKAIRLSPQKLSIQAKVEKRVSLKLNSLLSLLIDKSFSHMEKTPCRSCLTHELEIERLVSSELRKIKRNGPQH